MIQAMVNASSVTFIPGKVKIYSLGVILLLGLTTNSFALPTDRAQVMQLRAGSADINQQSHRGVYTDHVQLDQGSTHITAAMAITEGNTKNELIKAIIQGNASTQAHYWTLTDTKKPIMHAYADTIYYYPQRHRIELVGHALVKQGDDSFSGPNICYDTQSQHVISKGDSQHQTLLIFHPGAHP